MRESLEVVGTTGTPSRLAPTTLLDRFRHHGREPVVVAAALCQAATIVLTWRLWDGRDTPPTLPIVADLATIPFAVLLTLTALGAAVRPRLFGPIQCAVLVLACAADQTRIQPEVLSLAVLMTAPAYGPAGRQLARWALAAMWFWAGAHKALSLDWPTLEPYRIANDLGWTALRRPAAIGIPLVEIMLGLSALWRRSWPFTRWVGLATHLGILVVLSPLFGYRNIAVWPWQVALAVAAFFLFSPQEEPWKGTRRPLALVLAGSLMLYPAAFYWRGDDAYVSHHLYSSSVPIAIVCQPTGCEQNSFPMDGIRVPFPPEPRLFVQRFEATCSPGDTLTIFWPATRVTSDRTELRTCPDRAAGRRT